MVGVHQSVRAYSVRFLEELRRHNYVTPKNYLDYVGAYKAALADKRQEIDEMAARLDGGLQKLVQAAAEVGGPAGSGAVGLLCGITSHWSASPSAHALLAHRSGGCCMLHTCYLPVSVLQ